MSVQFGRWNFVGQPPALDYVEKVNATLAPYGPDSNQLYSKGGVTILYRGFHTTKESHGETQPHISSSGAVMTWDGRLDNRAELINEFHHSLTINSTDVAIVAASYEKWGAKTLGKLIGDWALSIWDPRECSVVLAKDPIGTKHLYYSFDDKQLTWSTLLDPLVLFAGRTFAICEEYVAGWFAHFPAAHLTPYVEIRAVPPSSSVLLRPGRHIVSKYWDFNPAKRIRYRSDAEYEEHFRTVFTQAVQRRLRSDRPILAELSGGMDSTSIVCMADLIIALGHADCQRLDTISWFNNSQPATDELPYVSTVEEKRGRVGCHIDLGAQGRREESGVNLHSTFTSEFDNDGFSATPVSKRPPTSEVFRQTKAYMTSQGHRVTLSGIGGESATGGGVPTPRTELQDLLARGRFVVVTRQLEAWAVKMRQSRLRLLSEAARGFFVHFSPLSLFIDMRPAAWFRRDFICRHHSALCGYPFRVKLLGPLPSFQDHLYELDCERRLMAFYRLDQDLLREVRYPYLDRDLLEFIYAIPPEQIVRVGQRRSLMKRALVRVIPAKVLHRRRKALVPTPQQNSSTEWPGRIETGHPMAGSSLGIIDPDRFEEALRKARRNEGVSSGSLMKTLTLESWLHHLITLGVLRNPISINTQNYSSTFDASEVQAPHSAEDSAS